MSRTAIVGNYAEVLLELAAREGGVDVYGDWLADLSASYRHERQFRLFLDTPRVALEEKKEALREALGDEAPEPFVRFVLLMLDKGRHRFLPEVEKRYRELMDERRGRVHATITVAREPSQELEEEIARALTGIVGQEVVPRFRTDEDLVGGLVVRVGDHVMDGSLQRRLADLKQRLLRQEARREAT